ncbi:SMI1/KNR4 family protein [Chryseobacterium capnotolerans]|uniref:SMI1/KNR4 family protein n=1 Tax=Chryseobacterium TaxID=59732 RepID=UPI00083B87C7|nr:MULTISPECIES: SMI1/KNR4 family protein [Chryseobacterium]UHO38485.1 SMI1/KNR4 family protein [Chryseobacterium capnotolerans]
MEELKYEEGEIEEIIDRTLNFWVENKLNQLPGDIEDKMLAPDQPDEEWKFWLPVTSTITDDELHEFEAEAGFTFPEDFKIFLKYKHFYELQISEVSFCSLPVSSWRASLREMMFETYPREFLFDKGYVPFAIYSDWGLLCFDTHNNNAIVRWDHEDQDSFEYQHQSFYELLTDISKA